MTMLNSVGRVAIHDETGVAGVAADAVDAAANFS